MFSLQCSITVTFLVEIIKVEQCLLKLHLKMSVFLRHSVVAMYVHLCVLAEALHLANLICATGYIFPIDDHILLVKNDGAYYRFQVGRYLLASHQL